MLLAPAIAWSHGGGGYSYVPIITYQSAPTLPPPEIGNYDKIHTIGIVSALGSSARLHRHNGIMNDADVHYDISHWDLDAVASATLSKLLSPRFSVIDMPVDHFTVANFVSPSLYSTDMAPLQAFLQSLHRTDVDAFLVVKRTTMDLDPGTAGLDLELTADDRPTVWANYELILIDAKTFQEIARAYSRTRLAAQLPTVLPGVTFTTPLATDEKITLDDRAAQRVRRMFASTLQLTLTETVRSLRFGNKLPRPGARMPVPIPPDSDALRDVKTVAVISGVGDRLEMAYRGTFFRHSLTDVPVPDLNLDSMIEAKLTNILSKRFAVKNATVDRAKLANFAATAAGASPSASDFGLKVDAGVDAYVVVIKQLADAGAPTNQALGLGLWRFGSDATAAFANCSVFVFDGHTLALRRRARFMTGPDWTGPANAVAVANSTWPDGAPLTAEQTASIGKALSSLMDEMLPETAYRMGLTGYQDGLLLSALNTGAATVEPVPAWEEGD
jgi:hypothetical protein